MNRGMKMLAVSSVRNNDRRGETRNEDRRMGYDQQGGMEYSMENRSGDRMDNRSGERMESRYRGGDRRSEYEGRDYTRNEYNGSDMNYGGVEGRFRDRRGREHYDDGRYAPMRNNMEENMEMRHSPYIPPVYDRGGERMNQIGFRAEGDMMEMGGDYRMSADYPRMDEMSHMRGGSRSSGHASGNEVAPFDKEMAMEWTEKMQNEDGTKGPHWTMEQAKQVMAQKGVSLDPFEFWAALNAMYSDYSKVFRKHGVGDKLDFYVDMAKAFIEDKDAKPDKVSRYFTYIVK